MAASNSRFFHVTPNSNGSGWQVKVQKATRVLGRFPRKTDALDFARDTARNFISVSRSRRSHVVVHDRFGCFSRTISVGA